MEIEVFLQKIRMMSYETKEATAEQSENAVNIGVYI